MDGAIPSGETMPSHDFFARARARLNLDVPPALNDHTAEAKRGDLDLDPATWEAAGIQATRPAAVLIPVVDRPDPTVLLTAAHGAAEPSRADRLPRRQDRCG